MPLDPEDVEKLEQLNDELTTALRNGDVSAILDMVTDDAVVIPARGTLVKGGSIQRYFLSLAQQAHNPKFMALDLDAVGSDAAREVGTFSFRTRGQNSVRVIGSYLFLWQRVAGEWRLGSAALTRNTAAGPGMDRSGTGPA